MNPVSGTPPEVNSVSVCNRTVSSSSRDVDAPLEKVPALPAAIESLMLTPLLVRDQLSAGEYSA